MTYTHHPMRIQRSRRRGWKLPCGAVICTRPGEYGNPFVGPDAIMAFRRFALLLMTGERIEATNWWRYRKGESRRKGVDITKIRPADFCKVAGKEFDAILSLPKGAGTLELQKPNKWVRELRGKLLACWCPLDKPCHVDVLAELANSMRGV